jgi:hypothetical protein
MHSYVVYFRLTFTPVYDHLLQTGRLIAELELMAMVPGCDSQWRCTAQVLERIYNVKYNDDQVQRLDCDCRPECEEYTFDKGDGGNS